MNASYSSYYPYLWDLLLIIVALVIGSLSTTFLSKPFKIYCRKLNYKLFSKDFKYNLFFKYYFTSKTNDLDSQVFEKIKQKFPKFNISKNKISPESMTIKPEKLGIKVNVFLDSVDELENYDENDESLDVSNEYVLTIKLDSFLWIGYKRLEILNDYIALFNEIKEIVKDYCFSGRLVNKSFIVCDVIRDVNKITDLNKIDDESKKMKISFVENDIKIVSNEPLYLIETIKKYIGY